MLRILLWLMGLEMERSSLGNLYFPFLEYLVKVKSQKYKIYGKGLGCLVSQKNELLNFSNSGTLARLLIGILSTTPNIQIKLKGDHSLNKRSMGNLIDLMSKFGASFH